MKSILLLATVVLFANAIMRQRIEIPEGFTRISKDGTDAVKTLDAVKDQLKTLFGVQKDLFVNLNYVANAAIKPE